MLSYYVAFTHPQQVRKAGGLRGGIKKVTLKSVILSEAGTLA